MKKVIEHEKEVQKGLHDLDKTKFLVSIEGSDKPDEIVDYNVVLDYVNAQMDDNLDPTEVFWKFKEIVGKQGPLQSNHADYRGSTYNVMVAWEDGTYTYEPLKIIAADDPVTCALYAKKNNLLNTPGWKRFKDIAKRDKKMIRKLRVNSDHSAQVHSKRMDFVSHATLKKLSLLTNKMEIHISRIQWLWYYLNFKSTIHSRTYVRVP